MDIATIAGLVFHTFRTHRTAHYDPRFTNDLIGVFVPCLPERQTAVQQLLKGAGATEVRVEA